MTEYNPDYYIEKFKAIPEEEWCIKAFTIPPYGPGKLKHCALGHCGWIAGEEHALQPAEARKLSELFSLNCDRPVTDVNDYPHESEGILPLSTPKSRILTALYELKAKGVT